MVEQSVRLADNDAENAIKVLLNGEIEHRITAIEYLTRSIPVEKFKTLVVHGDKLSGLGIMPSRIQLISDAFIPKFKLLIFYAEELAKLPAISPSS